MNEPQSNEVTNAATNGPSLGTVQSGRDELEIALQLRDAALYLSETDEDNFAILILRRLQVLLSIRALLNQEHGRCPKAHLTEEDWQLAVQVAPIRELTSSLTAQQLATLKSSLSQDAELSLVGLSAKQRKQLARTLRRAAHLLNESIITGKLKVTRSGFGRRLVVGTAIAAVLGLLGLGVVKLAKHSRAPDLALHRPVSINVPTRAEYKHGEQLVDGDTTNMGFHTESEEQPYATIDLGESKRIDRVIVHNRADCCKDRAIPLQLEVSDDGKKFQLLAERKELFDKWIAKDLNAKGRYVRLRLAAHNIFHLAEVEVY
jgi:hypothetical protein